eukprot:UN03304
MEKFYTQSTRFDCIPWSFKKGDEITVFAIMDRVDDQTPSAPLQHLLMRGAYALEKEDDFEEDIFNYNTSICFEDPNECMLYHQPIAMFIGAVLFNGSYVPLSSAQTKSNNDRIFYIHTNMFVHYR